MTDPVLLQRMVMNLANNAIRYTERGTVMISCRRVDGGRKVRLDVADSGIGISPTHQEDIFREFYQVGNSGRDRAQGLGLGLNIVERTAQLLGHAITLRSALGCGTRFSIHLPAAQAVEAVLGDVEPGLAQQHVGEQSTAHADLAVDAPDREVHAFAVQCLLPGQHVLVHAVDEGTVEVEQEGGRRAGHVRFLQRVAGGRRALGQYSTRVRSVPSISFNEARSRAVIAGVEAMSMTT